MGNFTHLRVDCLIEAVFSLVLSLEIFFELLIRYFVAFLVFTVIR